MTGRNMKRWRAVRRTAGLVAAGFVAGAVLPAAASAACTGTQRIVNPGFETGTAPWVQTGVVIKPDQNGINANGNWYAGLRSNGDSVTQTTTLESGCVNYRFTFKYKVFKTALVSLAEDKLLVTFNWGNGSVYTATGATNLLETGLFATKSVYFPNIAPGNFTVRFWTQQSINYPTHFVVDDVNLRPY